MTKSKQYTTGNPDVRVILGPRYKTWREYFARATTFSGDYPDHIEDAPPQEREKL